MKAGVVPSERADASVTHVINVRDVKKHFPVREGVLPARRRVTFAPLTA